MAATKTTVRSDYGPNPNGAKLYTAEIRQRRFKRPRVRADGSLTGFLPETVEPQHRYSHVSGRDFGPLIHNTIRHIIRNGRGFPSTRRADRGSGRGDFVKVDCAACHHVALLTPEALRSDHGVNTQLLA